MNIIDCLKQFEKCKIGEVLVQSIERDGSLRGFDNKLNDFIKKYKCSSNSLWRSWKLGSLCVDAF